MGMEVWVGGHRVGLQCGGGGTIAEEGASGPKMARVVVHAAIAMQLGGEWSWMVVAAPFDGVEFLVVIVRHVFPRGVIAVGEGGAVVDPRDDRRGPGRALLRRDPADAQIGLFPAGRPGHGGDGARGGRRGLAHEGHGEQLRFRNAVAGGEIAVGWIVGRDGAGDRIGLAGNGEGGRREGPKQEDEGGQESHGSLQIARLRER